MDRPHLTGAPGSSRTLTPVFTDLADSTALKRQRADQAVGEPIARHRALVVRLATEGCAQMGVTGWEAYARSIEA